MVGVAKFIPDWSFIRRFFKVALPIVLQQILINSAIIVDNLFIGRLGSEAIMAIGIVNTLHFFFTFSMFGMVRGASIYISQYNGAKDHESLKTAAGIKQKLMLINSLGCIIIIWIFAPNLVALFIDPLPKNSNVINLAVNYYRIFIISTLFKTQNFGFSTTFQELGKPYFGLKSSIASVIVNVVANYILVFGWGPIPAFGMVGAAYGTIIAKFATTMVWIFLLDTSYLTKNIHSLIFRKSKSIFRKIIRKTIPLTMNELLWSAAIVIKFSLLGRFGGNELAAISIQRNIDNFVSVIWAGLAGGTIYLIGKKLGSGELHFAKERAYKIVGMSFIMGVVITIILNVIAMPIVSIYKINDTIYTMSISLIRVLSLWYPIWLVTGAFFFILNSGGQTTQVVKLDLSSTWLIMLPVLYLSKNYFLLGFFTTLILSQLVDFIKLFQAVFYFKKYDWLKSLVKKPLLKNLS